jgi:uncharacterized protein (DUF2141 family)
VAGGILTAAEAARSEAGGVLRIRFSGLEEARGALLVSVADSRESFESDERARLSKSAPVEGAVETIVFRNVAPGEYAVKIFHDANGNQKLDIGWRGPTEKYGFSNDAVGFMGPPDFDDARFSFDGNELTIDIEAR